MYHSTTENSPQQIQSLTLKSPQLEVIVTFVLYAVYNVWRAKWCFLLPVNRGSAQQAGMGDIIVTPTSPAPLTRKTSAASSTTVETSFSGCTCGSTSCCDGRRTVFSQKHRNTSDNEKPRTLSLWTPLFHRSV